MTMKLVQVKSAGRSLKDDVRTCLERLQIDPQRALAHEHRIQCFVKDKSVKNLTFRPLQNTLITLLLSDELFQKDYLKVQAEWVAYEDDAIVVVDKPYGVSTQSTQKFGEDHLYGAMISYYTKKNVSRLAYIGLHHRLDRDTSGLVLFTKKRSANKSISDQFKNHTIEKKYHAIVSGATPPEKRWTQKGSIGRDFKSTHFKFQIDPKGDSALTEFEWISEISSGMHLIECFPKTGRTHQIRIHLAASNLPIVGDRTYGGLSNKRMLLHASELQFTHPISKKSLSVKSKNKLS
jgi:RluA family pseudouridine synthase